MVGFVVRLFEGIEVVTLDMVGFAVLLFATAALNLGVVVLAIPVDRDHFVGSE